MTSKLVKVLLLVMTVAFIAVGCAKAPTDELASAEAALKAAKAAGAEKCSFPEYSKAKLTLAKARSKIHMADKEGDSSLYEEAKQELLEAIAGFEKAKLLAKQRNDINTKAEAKLAGLKSELDALAADSAADKSMAYLDAKKKYVEAKKLIDECKGREAMALIRDAMKNDIPMAHKQIAEYKASMMKKEKPAPKMVAKPKVDRMAYDMYKVKKGDTLWDISEMKYVNPFLWPLIWWANKADIKDPDLIFPGQDFKIRKFFENEEMMKAKDYSKSRGPWSLFDGK